MKSFVYISLHTPFADTPWSTVRLGSIISFNSFPYRNLSRSVSRWGDHSLLQVIPQVSDRILLSQCCVLAYFGSLSCWKVKYFFLSRCLTDILLLNTWRFPWFPPSWLEEKPDAATTVLQPWGGCNLGDKLPCFCIQYIHYFNYFYYNIYV